jgi:hypothetical protein
MLPAAFGGGWQAPAVARVPQAARRYALLVPGHYSAPLGAVFHPPLG